MRELSPDVKSGDQFGRLTVQAPARREGRKGWRCVCKCGKIVLARDSALRRGAHQSCGCARRERSAAQMRDMHTKHGSTNTAEFRIWTGLLSRCLNPNVPNYNRYGGRGISVDPSWVGVNGFTTFLRDVGKRPSGTFPGGKAIYSIDRHPDPDGNYEPGNVRWATAREQARNRKNNRLLVFEGEQHPMVEWAQLKGMRPHTLERRLNSGWSVERALTESVHVEKRNRRAGGAA